MKSIIKSIQGIFETKLYLMEQELIRRRDTNSKLYINQSMLIEELTVENMCLKEREELDRCVTAKARLYDTLFREVDTPRMLEALLEVIEKEMTNDKATVY